HQVAPACRQAGGTICNDGVKNLPEYLHAGDLLVFNDTKVFPARIFAGKMEILLLGTVDHGPGTRDQKHWRCLAKPLKKIKEGMELVFSETLKGIVTQKTAEDIEIKFECENLEKELEKIGLPPLPPYIQRKSEADYTSEDRERYQSIFAKHKGSAAAPTASFHFSETLIETIRQKGIDTAFVTLHVSRDTFLPIREEEVTQHKMHGERFCVPEETQRKIAETKKNGGRVIAVGTTATRALESDWMQPITRHYIYPGYSFKIVDGILTNFHQPASTLLLLVSAFAGREFILQAYQEAIAQGYRLFSYGDCMLIL
ncbi:MAG: tRNA preQ1(34) S-adenosylmethionine ribosyltransferase-isomerase QueA, partial [bacterium]|nr:tRNA preQ1(34) S-adenosylmethionine ribosyltransferase-isomerase QueA [bacterium]